MGLVQQKCGDFFSEVLLDKELHKWILSKNFDGIISETFDFCGLCKYLKDYAWNMNQSYLSFLVFQSLVII